MTAGGKEWNEAKEVAQNTVFSRRIKLQMMMTLWAEAAKMQWFLWNITLFFKPKGEDVTQEIEAFQQVIFKQQNTLF